MNKSDITKLKKGDKLSEIQYYEVLAVGTNSVAVKNERGMEFNISSSIVREGIFSANQFTETKELTKTELADLFSHIGDTVFTVNFNKQLKDKDAREGLFGLYANAGGTILSEKEYQTKVKEVLKSVFKGEERTLIGYRIGSDFNLGRSHVIDLQAEKGTNPEWDSRIRQVDHRSINYVIYKNTKFTLKK